MNTLLLVIIIFTAAISFKGFNDQSFFQKYMFQIGAVERKEYYRLLTSGFLHADIMHLAFNMLTLYFFTNIVIDGFGTLGFFIIYIGSILLGNLFSLFMYKKQVSYSAIGASGGVSGILFAAIAMNPHIGIGFLFIPIPIPGYIFGFLYFAYSVYMMLYPKAWDNYGHSAHLGGAGFGLLYAVMLHSQAAMMNAPYIFIMSLPLLFLAYMIFVKKKI